MDTCSNINLSVIVPVFNASQYLHACIDSILVVDRQDMEVILVDDGSTDHSGIICDKYADKDKRVIVFHKQNGGVSSARNLGLKNARGKWITFVDADDKATQELLTYIPEDNADLYCFNWRYSTGETENERVSEEIHSRGELLKFLNQHLADYIFRTPWSKVFKSGIIRKNNITFNHRFKLGEDNLFVLEYLCHSNTIHTRDEYGYIYLRPLPLKYKMNAIQVDEYFRTFIPLYKTLNVNCPSLLRLKLLSFKLRVVPEDLKLWEMHCSIRKAENLVLYTYNIKELVSIFVQRVLCFLTSPKRYAQ